MSGIGGNALNILATPPSSFVGPSIVSNRPESYTQVNLATSSSFQTLLNVSGGPGYVVLAGCTNSTATRYRVTVDGTEICDTTLATTADTANIVGQIGTAEYGSIPVLPFADSVHIEVIVPSGSPIVRYCYCLV